MMDWSPFRRKLGKIALVTANFGGIDEPKPLPDRNGIDATYYTDEGSAARCRPEVAATWSRVVVPNYPRHDFNPRLRARYFKHQIHRLDEVRDARWLVWADSTLQFHELQFVSRWASALARLPEHKRLLVVPHPERKTIWEEFRFIQGLIDQGHEYLAQRYANEHMPEQMAYFKSRGWDLESPLWCGTFWMMENSELMRRAWDAWWDQNLRFGMMDQLSLPVILTLHGIDPQPLPVNLWKNEHFTWVAHQRAM
jgi:hypothetical protein